ncbi:MAG: calcium-binding protein [Leptolyngbyaceae cyanobacterium CRU_2_3]|nr:calcium-binding protein [Leptolyngbyaceae cyanobacterium CRU_2_3]
MPTATFVDVLEDPENAIVKKGGNSNETLIGSDCDNDVIYGFGGNDNLAGGLGEDLLFGGDGDDVIRGDLNKPGDADTYVGDSDILYGGKGNDRLGGKGGSDKLYGDDGDDTLFGDAGDDLLRGGKGKDRLIGGAGEDTFALAYGEGTDIITDFKVGKDLIGLVGTIKLNQLSLSQSDHSTLLTLGKNVLAQITGVTVSQLTEASFVNIAPTA